MKSLPYMYAIIVDKFINKLNKTVLRSHIKTVKNPHHGGRRSTSLSSR